MFSPAEGRRATRPHPTPSPGKVLQPVRLYFLQTILSHCPQGLTMRSDDNTANRPEVARRTLAARGALMACTPGTPTARPCGGSAAPRLIPSGRRHARRTGSEQVRRPRPGSAEARGAGLGGWGDLSLFKPPSRRGHVGPLGWSTRHPAWSTPVAWMSWPFCWGSKRPVFSFQRIWQTDK